MLLQLNPHRLELLLQCGNLRILLRNRLSCGCRLALLFGSIRFLEELANKIRDLAKPTMAYTDSEMASAAYWIASAADKVVASPSSTVGSVGVYMVVADYSKAAEAQGIKMVVIKSGKFKGAGIAKRQHWRRAGLAAQPPPTSVLQIGRAHV